jgi:hypothetical protein
VCIGFGLWLGACSGKGDWIGLDGYDGCVMRDAVEWNWYVKYVCAHVVLLLLFGGQAMGQNSRGL